MTAVCHRRALHRIPELDRKLPKTLAYLRAVLENCGCTLLSPTEGSLCAFFDFGREKTVAFRADADALPIRECSEADYASRHPGAMHACGHDGHMAILLALAQRLGKKEELPRNVLLIFQPAEETTGGARDICQSGVLEQFRVQEIYGLHLWPGLEAGKIFTRKGALMARSSELTVDVYGKSAHIAKAWEGVDALEGAMEFYRRALALERSLPQDTFRLLKFGKFQSGTVRNAISAHSHLEGSLRAFQEETFDLLRSGLEQIARDVEKTLGCTVTIHLSEGYPAVWNPEALVEQLMERLDFSLLDSPAMTAEDFSWYQQFVPGVFFFLGLGETPALHAENFDFDDSLLEHGVDFFERIAEL